jgi:MFS family permease
VVGVLTFVYIFSFIDRQILNLLVRPIRRDLGISDFQMSLLMGFSFALFYTLFGIPLGRLADSRSRRTIIAVGFTVWSLMTAGCGLARNFVQMLLLRVGVGVGEAALSPAAYSIITDYFPPKRRATAISVYSMGIYIGSGIAFIVGGLVAGLAAAQETWNVPLVGATRPWQVVFFIVGIPGVFLALLMYTVREPARRGIKTVKTADGGLRCCHSPLMGAAPGYRLSLCAITGGVNRRPVRFMVGSLRSPVLSGSLQAEDWLTGWLSGVTAMRQCASD